MKKIIAMLLVLVMAASLVACGGNTNTAPETTAPATVPETSEAVLDGGADITVDAVTVMTHEEYVAAELQTEVVVEFYVQGAQGWWFDSNAGHGKMTVYGQDENGGYFAYELNVAEEDAAKLVAGTKIRVTGYKAEWAGEVEIVDGTFEFVEGGDTWIAEATDVTELLGTEELIAHQNELVSFTGLTIEAIEYKNGEPGDDIYVTVGYNGASYSFCVERYLTGPESVVYTTVGTLNVGDMVDVEGFVYWYDGVNPHITSINLVECECGC